MSLSIDKLVRYATHFDKLGHKIAANAVDMACAESDGSVSNALSILAKYALMLDSDGLTEAAYAIDHLIKEAAELSVKDRSELYDSKNHREQSLFHALKDEADKALEPEMDTWRGGGHPLLTRYSPDYPGVMMQRIQDGVYQDLLSKKVYDFHNGFISDQGHRYFGGSVSYQTPTAQNYLGSPQVLESKHLKIRPR